MIDMLVILITTGVCLWVTIRAAMLDRLVPWFVTPKPAPPQEDATPAGRPVAPKLLPWRERAAAAAPPPGSGAPGRPQRLPRD